MSTDELESHCWDDLIQDGMAAGLKADKAYSPHKGHAWGQWVISKISRDTARAAKRYTLGGVVADSSAESSLEELPGDESQIADRDLEFYALEEQPLVEQLDMARQLAALRQRLPRELYRLLALHYGLEGEPQSTRQLASEFGMSHAAIQARLKTALESAAYALTPSKS